MFSGWENGESFVGEMVFEVDHGRQEEFQWVAF